ncbi:MAG: hypothetical protein M3433_06845 [Actinomycetota bacterium]|nr:hypothetical protein [Actinomycetota bacterium]
MLVTFILGVGAATDAFLAAYSLYVPLAALGASFRTTLIPLVGIPSTDTHVHERVSELLSRTLLLSASASILFLAVSQVLAPLLTASGPNVDERALRLTLLILTPAAGMQVYAGAAAAALSSIRRFAASISLYVLAGLVALCVSAVLMSVFGALGAPSGLLAGAFTGAVGHTLYLRRLGVRPQVQPRRFTDRSQLRLLWRALAGVALGASQQLGLAVALSAIVGEGRVTVYAYAFYITGILLNLSVLPVAMVTLPDLLERLAAEGPSARREHLRRVAPFVFAVLVPALICLISFGEPLLAVAFGSVLSLSSVSEMHDIIVRLSLFALSAAVFALASTLLVALGRWVAAVVVAAINVLLHILAIYGFAHGDPTNVAAGHAAATLCATALLFALVLGREAPRAGVELAWAIAPAFAFATIFPLLRAALGDDPSVKAAAATAVLGLGLYCAAALVLWRSVATAFLALRQDERTSASAP